MPFFKSSGSCPGWLPNATVHPGLWEQLLFVFHYRGMEVALYIISFSFCSDHLFFFFSVIIFFLFDYVSWCLLGLNMTSPSTKEVGWLRIFFPEDVLPTLRWSFWIMMAPSVHLYFPELVHFGIVLLVSPKCQSIRTGGALILHSHESHYLCFCWLLRWKKKRPLKVSSRPKCTGQKLRPWLLPCIIHKRESQISLPHKQCGRQRIQNTSENGRE